MKWYPYSGSEGRRCGIEWSGMKGERAYQGRNEMEWMICRWWSWWRWGSDRTDSVKVGSRQEGGRGVEWSGVK